jgi:DNA-binding response OmpR family regulator
MLRLDDGEYLKIGALKLDFSSMQVTLSEKPVPMSVTEFRMLKELVSHVNTVRTRDDLRRDALNNLEVNDLTVDVYIATLRRKLEDFGKNIKTVRFLGYRFVSPYKTSL